MITDMDILKRMDDITSELAQIKKIGAYNVFLSEGKQRGDIQIQFVSTKNKGVTLSWVVGYEDSLEHISDSLGYNNAITPRSANMISTDELDMCYFDDLGHLILRHEDGSREEFKCEKKIRAEITSILQARLGDKMAIKVSDIKK